MGCDLELGPVNSSFRNLGLSTKFWESEETIGDEAMSAVRAVSK